MCAGVGASHTTIFPTAPRNLYSLSPIYSPRHFSLLNGGSRALSRDSRCARGESAFSCIHHEAYLDRRYSMCQMISVLTARRRAALARSGGAQFLRVGAFDTLSPTSGGKFARTAHTSGLSGSRHAISRTKARTWAPISLRVGRYVASVASYIGRLFRIGQCNLATRRLRRARRVRVNGKNPV